MKQKNSKPFFILILFVCAVLSTRGQGKNIPIDYSAYDAKSEIKISDSKNVITVKWEVGTKTNFATFRVQEFSFGAFVDPPPPLIQSVGVIESGKTTEIFKNLQPEYAIFLGERDLEKRNGWQIFFDYAYKKSYAAQKSILDTKKVVVTSAGNRATISFEGLKAGEFTGALNFTFYQGDALMQMEAAMATKVDARAYLYHAGFSTLENQIKDIAWQSNTTDELVRQTSQNDFATPKTTRYRTIIAESKNGALATFPSPHRFLPPLDGVGNYGFNWSGQNYLDLFNGYGWGVRQPVFGDRRQVPWLNAPPSTVQKMDMFIYFDNQKAEDILENIKKYTHNDQYVDIPGYKKFASHFHVEHTLDLINEQKKENTKEIPKDFINPEFVQYFKKLGVDIVHLAEFHRGDTPNFGTAERLSTLKLMHSEMERLSTDKFLLLPGEEPNVGLGGHWISIFPKPVYWVLNNKDKKPFVEKVKGFGDVYHVANEADVYKLFQKEKGLMWVAHARIKGSTGYPDKYFDKPFFNSANYLGTAWKNMPVDLSIDKMGTRVFKTLDEMNNLGKKKLVISEVDVFDIKNDYELYGAMNINYIKLDKLPKFSEGWAPVVDALKSGNVIVSTGEILLENFSINKVEGGGTLKLSKNKTAKISGNLSWTFPLRNISIITGDDKTIEETNIDLSNTSSFGKTVFAKQVNLSGKKWIRMEIWDVAGNVTFTNPIWISN